VFFLIIEYFFNHKRKKKACRQGTQETPEIAKQAHSLSARANAVVVVVVVETNDT
jgi:hypothetical protein